MGTADSIIAKRSSHKPFAAFSDMVESWKPSIYLSHRAIRYFAMKRQPVKGEFHCRHRYNRNPNELRDIFDTGKRRTDLAFTKYQQLRSHVIWTDEDGQLLQEGQWRLDVNSLTALFANRMLAATKNWSKRRILLYACSGLDDERTTLRHLESWRKQLLANEIYPFFFIWQLDLFDQITKRLPRARNARVAWMAAMENALIATDHPTGGARMVATQLKRLVKHKHELEIHMVGHSGGAVLLSLLAQLMATEGLIDCGPLMGTAGMGMRIGSITLWAPACTIDTFKKTFIPLVSTERVKALSVLVLDSNFEQHDTCGCYNSSFLNVVSNTLEGRIGLPYEFLLNRGPVPLLGIERWVRADAGLSTLMQSSAHGFELIVSPNAMPLGSEYAARATHHRNFPHDNAVLTATTIRILNNGLIA